MRFALLAALVVLSPGALAQAQVPSPEKGDKALLFSFNGLNLGSYAGGLGGKVWVGSTAALTAGLQVGGVERTEETPGLRSNVYRDLTARLGVGTEFHLSTDRLSPFVSVGLGVGLHRRTSETEVVNGEVVTSSGYTERTRTIDGGVGFGLEYRLSERFSLSGQQRLRGEVEWGSQTDSGGAVSPRETDIDGYSFGAGATSLTLGVYF